MLKVCKACKVSYDVVKQWGNGHIYFFTNSRVWLRGTCPKCQDVPVPKVGIDVFNKRVTKRKCRKCNKLLDRTRYFKCKLCMKPEASDTLSMLIQTVPWSTSSY